MNGFNCKINLLLSILPLSLTACSTPHTNLQPNLQLPQKPPLLLAKSFQAGNQISQFLVSEKLDGMRAYWNGCQLLTRNGHVINAPSWFTKDFPSQPLDGELWVGRAQFERLLSIVRKKTPISQEWLKVKYMVFDLPRDLSPFIDRHNKLSQLITTSDNQSLFLVKQKHLHNSDALSEMLQVVLSKGGEGLMLHKKNSLYQAKRSLDLQKLKPFDDAEAIVIAHIEGKGKYRGILGAIEVVNAEGKKFKIGSGFSLQQRQSPPPINSRITYRYRGKTKYNTPRFATYLRLRSDDE